MGGDARPLSIVVVGGSGDLARRKIYPALFALYGQGLLPAGFRVFGFARSDLTRSAFQARIEERLTCRYVPGEACAEKMAAFLDRCHYCSGQYASAESFLDLYASMKRVEGRDEANRLFYLAIPPSTFLDVARALGNAGLVKCSDVEPWSRVVIEKPFGRDRASSDALTEAMGHVFTEDQTYRIDHYLGKEVIQNLMVLRFANLVFEPLWNREFIRSVQIAWQEDLGVEGRGGYFDRYGIIRDVMQNHLLQILSLVAMEPPKELSAHPIRDEKVRVLRDIPPVSLADIVIGQYTASERGGRRLPAYVEDESVPGGSLTPTFAGVVLNVDNARWQGVPFVIHAGKAMDRPMTEIRIRFREVRGNMFCRLGRCPLPNELVIRVQPDEAVYLQITNKVPGLTMALGERNLDLRYKSAFPQEIPDAYESLLLDVIRRERSLFIRRDELEAAWDIFTPVLNEMESRRLAPEPYPFGSAGPPGFGKLVRERGVEL